MPDTLAVLVDSELYASNTFYEDVRFYLGWSLGLAVAPNPVMEN